MSKGNYDDRRDMCARVPASSSCSTFSIVLQSALFLTATVAIALIALFYLFLYRSNKRARYTQPLNGDKGDRRNNLALSRYQGMTCSVLDSCC